MLPRKRSQLQTNIARLPLVGTRQGSGNSSIVWLFICCSLFDVNEERAQVSTCGTPESFAISRHQAHKDSQLWHHLLQTCNHALELPKCCYHAIHYAFLPTVELQITDLPPT
jgi:hypothetical protein